MPSQSSEAKQYPTRKDFPVLGVTTPHTRGVLVKEAQSLLKYNGHGNFKPGKIDGDFGHNTAQASYRAKYWCGFPRRKLKQDFGENLRSYLLPKGHPQREKLPASYLVRARARVIKKKLREKRRAQQTLGTKAIAIAKRQVGIKESPPGSNRCKYTAWYPMIGPWCAMFVSWCYYYAGYHTHRWASVMAMVSDAQAHRYGIRVTSHEYVKVGDPVAYHFTEPYQHVGMFDGWIRYPSTFWSIDGNTTSGTGSEFSGGEVARRVRYTTSVQEFMHLG